MENNVQPNIPLVVILGPTAVGKTTISIQLAKRFNGEIVSADSRLFYRGMDIGTAKPSIEDLRFVPHHLIDVADPDETWSLGMFQKEANIAIKGIYSRGNLPFLVGGTGQFIHSIIEGWSIPAVEQDKTLRHVLEDWGNEIGSNKLHSKLALLDPHAAGEIDPSNVRRTVRALEVIFTTGKLFSEQRQKGILLYNTLILGLTLDRHELYNRIDERISEMVAMGFIDEVQQLLDQGYSPDLPTMSAIGYREIVAYLRGKTTLEEAIMLMKRRTRTFVRRQSNWFKTTDNRIKWFNSDQNAVHKLEEVIREWQISIL